MLAFIVTRLALQKRVVGVSWAGWPGQMRTAALRRYSVCAVVKRLLEIQYSVSPARAASQAASAQRHTAAGQGRLEDAVEDAGAAGSAASAGQAATHAGAAAGML